VLVRLRNTTPHDLTFVHAELEHGKWSGPDYPSYTPPGTVYAGTTWSWESQSDGIATGTQGRAVYAVAGTAATIEIRWDNPYIGHNSYKGIGPQPYLIRYSGGDHHNASIDFTVALVSTPMTAETNDQEIGAGSGHWMNSTAAMASNGLISGHTHAWVTSDLTGYHGSVFPAVLDSAGKVNWFGPKRTYGPDADWAPGTPSSYSEPWYCTVPPELVAAGRALVLFQFADPKNMLVRDLGILAKTVDVVAQIIKMFEGGK
jgi:hypothetical protein